MSEDCCGQCCFGCCASICTVIVTSFQQCCYGKTYGSGGIGGPRGCCNCKCFSIEDDAQEELDGPPRRKNAKKGDSHGIVTEQPAQKLDMKAPEGTPETKQTTSNPVPNHPSATT